MLVFLALGQRSLQQVAKAATLRSDLVDDRSNGNGTIDFPDFLILSGDFGRTAAAAAAAPAVDAVFASLFDDVDDSDDHEDEDLV